MEFVGEVLVVCGMTLLFVWFHMTYFFTKKAGSMAGLVMVLGILGYAYYVFYQEKYPMYVYAIVPGILLLIDAVFVGLRRLL